MTRKGEREHRPLPVRSCARSQRFSPPFGAAALPNGHPHTQRPTSLLNPLHRRRPSRASSHFLSHPLPSLPRSPLSFDPRARASDWTRPRLVPAFLAHDSRPVRRFAPEGEESLAPPLRVQARHGSAHTRAKHRKAQRTGSMLSSYSSLSSCAPSRAGKTRVREEATRACLLTPVNEA